MYDNELVKQVKQIKKIVIGVIIGIIAIILVFGSVYFVSEQENVVVTMFGNVVRTDTSGLHFKIPIIQKIKRVDITTHGTGIGYVVSEDGQNITTNDDGVMITSDFNLLNIDFYLEYRVTDPVAYLYNSNCPEDLLKNIALSNIRSVVVNYTVDEAMTTAKGQIQQEVKDNISAALAERNIGLSVVNITIQDSEPPTAEIIAAFKSVETAKQGADTIKNNALQYQNERIPEAKANADKIIQTAEATKATRIAEAEGQVARFNSMYAEYLDYPLITKQRLFYEALEEILPELKVIITDGDTETMLPLDSFSVN